MASNKQNIMIELQKRFEAFQHEARFVEKPFRVMGKPKITDKLVRVLVVEKE